MKAKFDVTGATILWFILVVGNFSSDMYVIDQCLDMGLAFDYGAFRCVDNALDAEMASYLSVRYPRYLLITIFVITLYFIRARFGNNRNDDQ